MAAEYAWSTLACALMVVITVLVHYESLRLITDRLVPRLRVHPRHELVYVILAVFLTHALEILLFAFPYHLLSAAGLGRIHGAIDGNFFDSLYFSLVSYTSLGFGDVYPLGGLRLLSGVEALIGLLMIGWSSYFTYLGMERLWKAHAQHDEVQRRHREGHRRGPAERP